MGLFSSLFGNSDKSSKTANGNAAAGKGAPINMLPLLKGGCGFNPSMAQNAMALAQKDPGFSAGDVNEKVCNWYIRIMDAWSAKNFEPIAPLFTQELYERFSQHLAAIDRAGYSNYIDNPTVLNSNVEGWYEEGGMELLGVTLSVRSIDTTYDYDNNLIAGRPGGEAFSTLLVCLCRPTGTKTKEAGAISTVNCPNCAAALQINKTSVCPFCGGVVSVNKSDWVIKGIQEIRRTA